MPPSSSIAQLVSDLADEQAELDAVFAGMGGSAWDTPTPALGWAVRDQASHLAFFDEMGTTAMVDPEGFRAIADAAMDTAGRRGDPMAEHLARGRAMSGTAVLEWWRQARAQFAAAAGGLEPGDRVPWFGPSMSAMSFVSARLMETWAHGQDVVDALGLERAPSGRLVHVAQLGVRARPFSYAVRGLDPPTEAIRVELDGPDGQRWSWDEDSASEQAVSGPALGFCLVVTQRRNLADTSLTVEGDVARQWMAIAQAFAGPPGPGRPPVRTA